MQIVEKRHAELLFDELGQIRCGKVHPARKLGKRQIGLEVFVDDRADLGHALRVAVRVPMARLRILHLKILIHGVHQRIDQRPVAQFISELSVRIVFYDARDQMAQGIIGGVVSQQRAVAEKVGMPRDRKGTLEEVLVEGDGHDGAVGTEPFAGRIRFDRKHVVCPGDKQLSVHGHLQRPGQQHIDAEALRRKGQIGVDSLDRTG